VSLRIKICGITSREDAEHAVACGADALGLVFFTGSPRFIAPDQARDIVASLPPFVTPVGLFVNAATEEIVGTASTCGLGVVQLHGDEPPEACRLEGLKVIKALRVRNAASLALADEYPVSSLLLDAWDPDCYGGSGRCFDWQLAGKIAARRRLILAGGLTPDNVAEAVRSVRPYAVDVSSGVEEAPGRKDPQKVAAFIRAARGAAVSLEPCKESAE